MNQINYKVQVYRMITTQTETQSDEFFNVNDDKINGIFKIYFPSFIYCL